MNINNTNAECGCFRCNQMKAYSNDWLNCCLYCMTNGKRSYDLYDVNVDDSFITSGEASVNKNNWIRKILKKYGYDDNNHFGKKLIID